MEFSGLTVIVAVIDTGIDIFHDSFRNADRSTRILELWDQAATTGAVCPRRGFRNRVESILAGRSTRPLRPVRRLRASISWLRQTEPENPGIPGRTAADAEMLGKPA